MILILMLFMNIDTPIEHLRIRPYISDSADSIDSMPRYPTHRTGCPLRVAEIIARRVPQRTYVRAKPI